MHNIGNESRPPCQAVTGVGRRAKVLAEGAECKDGFCGPSGDPFPSRGSPVQVPPRDLRWQLAGVDQAVLTILTQLD